MKTDIKSREDIERLVDSFYNKAGSDDLLGPIFHKLSESQIYRQTLYQYWKDALLSPGPDLNSRQFPKHLERMFTTQHFIRWLSLFLDTIDANYSGHTAEKAKVIVIKKSEEFQGRMELYRFG